MLAPMLLFINQHTIFEVPSFTHFKDMIGGKLKKTGQMTMSGKFVIRRLTLAIFYMCTKFGASRFSRSGDMIVGVEVEKGHVTLTTTHLGVVCHPNART